MKENLETKEKTCVLYTSDYHFELISLPYIHKKIQENKNVAILTENNLEKTIKEILKKITINEADKEKIFNINWKNETENKIKNIKPEVIKGNKKYIENINDELKENNKNYESIKIIDCYNIDEIGEEAGEIVQNYSKILKTTGEYKI